jgi:hypothetical protein
MRGSENYLISFFDNLKNVTPIRSIELSTLFELIKVGRWKPEIENCRIDLSKKKELPCFTPTGVFKQRNSVGIESYTGIVCLDIDNLDDPENLKEICKEIPWIWAAFITPSGKGLKIFVQTIPELSQFQISEAEVAFAFFEFTGFVRDDKCKDLARLQFVSFDENIYINQNPEIFKKKGAAKR